MKPRLRWLLLIVLLSIAITLVSHSLALAQTEETYTFAVAWSPDGNLIAYASGGRICDSGSDFIVTVINASTGTVTQSLSAGECSVSSLDWSPDGTHLVASLTGSELFRVWDVMSGQVVASTIGGQGAVSVRWHPSSNELLLTGADNGVGIFDTVTGQYIRSPQFGGTRAEWSPDGSRIVTGSAYEVGINIGDSLTGQLLATLPGFTVNAWSVAWSPDGKMLATTGSDNTVRTWDANTQQQLAITNIPGAGAVRWSPDSHWLAVASIEGFVQIIDGVSGEVIETIYHPEVAYSVDWNPDGTQLVIGGSIQPDSNPIQIVTFNPPTPIPIPQSTPTP